MSLHLNDLSITPAGAKPLFPPLSLHIHPGKIATLMGPSGSGKTSVLNVIGGHLDRNFAVAGEIFLNGQNILAMPADARRIGLMFQDSVLFPHLSVGDNLAFGLSASVKPRAARREMVEQALDQAGLGGLYSRDPATLSGGQKARAALMRALLADPAALLLDEPFSKLDTGLRHEIRAFTFSQITARNIPALMVTHDPGDAEAAGGQILHLGSI